jgi:hypothetical protein
MLSVQLFLTVALDSHTRKGGTKQVNKLQITDQQRDLFTTSRSAPGRRGAIWLNLEDSTLSSFFKSHSLVCGHTDGGRRQEIVRGCEVAGGNHLKVPHALRESLFVFRAPSLQRGHTH